jgi:hypothetical protein
LDFLFCLSELFIPTIPSIRSIKTDLRFFLLNPIVGVSSLSRHISKVTKLAFDSDAPKRLKDKRSLVCNCHREKNGSLR